MADKVQKTTQHPKELGDDNICLGRKCKVKVNDFKKKKEKKSY